MRVGVRARGCLRRPLYEGMVDKECVGGEFVRSGIIPKELHGVISGRSKYSPVASRRVRGPHTGYELVKIHNEQQSEEEVLQVIAACEPAAEGNGKGESYGRIDLHP